MERFVLKQKLLNTSITNMYLEEIIETIIDLIEKKQRSYIVAVNVDVIMKIEKDSYLKEITDQADIVLVDGQPLVWISKYYKNPIKQKVSGSDLVPQLCEKASTIGYSFYILGGRKEIAERAKKNLELIYPTIKIVGSYAPPIGFENDKDEIERINAMITESHPDILVVCFGCPKQERFIFENYKKYDAKVSICAGATVDFLAGNIKRAPRWMSNHGLEWFYRFLQEPKRLFKRYFVEDMKILRLVRKYR